MNNNSIQPSIALSVNLQTLPPAQKESTGRCQKIMGFCKNVFVRPITAGCKAIQHRCYSVQKPTEALKRIDQLASLGIEQAKEKGVNAQVVVGKLDTELNQKVWKIQAEAGLPKEETLESRLKAQEKEVEKWRITREKHQQNLCNKLSALTALIQMRHATGIVEDSNLRLMKIVKMVTSETNDSTLWQLFVNQYQLTFFQKLKAGWWYWFSYQTSLISNTVKTYVDKFVENTMKDLAKPNSETRTLVFRKTLEHVEDFLRNDYAATKRFAEGNGKLSLAETRNKEIESYYTKESQSSEEALKELCKAFSEKRVDTDSPEVPFFTRFHKAPIFGRFFKAFQWFVNRFIIQRLMKSKFLPTAIEDAVNKGLEATKPDRLPFAIAMTTFLTQQLVKLDQSNPGPSKPVKPIAGTESLPSTIKYLLRALALEGDQKRDKTNFELKKQFDEIEKDGGWLSYPGKKLDQESEKVIEQAVIEAANRLFVYLNDATKSGELFAHLLQLCSEPFSAEDSTEAALIVKYDQALTDLETAADNTLHKLVDNAIQTTTSEVLRLKNPEQINSIADISFKERKAVTQGVMEELTDLCDRMNAKITLAEEAPNPQNNTLYEIASFHEHMKAFANRKEIRNELPQLSGNLLNENWRIATPLYEKATEIEQKVLGLQKLQEEHPFNAAIETELKKINDVIQSFKNEFKIKPLEKRDEFVQTLQRSQEIIQRKLGAADEVTTTLSDSLSEIYKHSLSVANEEQVIRAVYALSPLKGENSSVGLLEQMLNYNEGRAIPRGFRPRDWREQMKKYLAHFPDNERRELEKLIGSGSKLREKWGQLQGTLQRIYEGHMREQDAHQTALDQVLMSASDWTNVKKEEYCGLKRENHSAMKAAIEEISMGVASLKKSAEEQKLTLPAPLGEWETTAGSALSTGVGAFIGSYLGPVGTYAGSFAGSMFGKWFYAGAEDKSKASPTATTAALVGGLAVAAAQGNLGALAQAGALGAGYAGWNGVRAAKSAGYNIAHPRVTALFKRARKFMHREGVWKAATTRVLKEMVAKK